MIDHLGITISDPKKSRRFYDAALAPIGYVAGKEIPAEFTGGRLVLGYGEPNKPDLWISEGKPNQPPIHVALRVDSREQVDAFYKAALAAGGTDNGPPGLRPQYHASYYAAFVHDPDGHNVEVVCHAP